MLLNASTTLTTRVNKFYLLLIEVTQKRQLYPEVKSTVHDHMSCIISSALHVCFPIQFKEIPGCERIRFVLTSAVGIRDGFKNFGWGHKM